MSPIASVAQWLDAHVALEADSGSISGDTHYYTLSPPFCKKYIKKKKIFWTTWWLDPFWGYVGNLVSFAKFSHTLKKIFIKKKIIQKEIIKKRS